MPSAAPGPSGRSVPLSTLLSDVTLDPEKSLVGQIRTLLEELIVGVRVLPGQRISEKEVSECLGASKTPVREALIGLRDAGLVTVVPKSGTYVAPIRIGAYLEACFVRLQLEIGAVRRAAERHDNAVRLAELEELLERQADAAERDDGERFLLLDEALHEAFFRMAGVPGAWSVLRRTQGEVLRIRHLKRRHRIRRVERVLSDHRRIVRAIGAGDPDAAEAALVRHIGSLDRELESLAEHPELMAFIDGRDPPAERSRTGAATARDPGDRARPVRAAGPAP